MALELLVFVAGIALLIKGADVLVSSASGIAHFLGVSKVLIGLSIVAIGTSAPEITVAILAALEKSADIAVGNILGTNIANIGLILGFLAVLSPIAIRREFVRKEALFLILASMFFLSIAFSPFQSGLNIFGGMALLGLFLFYMVYIVRAAKKQRVEAIEEHVEGLLSFGQRRPYIRNAALVVVGLAGIIVGGELLVRSSVVIARSLGVSEALIGLTVIAVGTSLPELFTNAVAILRKHTDIAVGNIIGSNIFNILFGIGTAATLSPIAVSPRFLFDALAMILFSALVFMFIMTRDSLSRREGGTLFALYLTYIFILFML